MKTKQEIFLKNISLLIILLLVFFVGIINIFLEVNNYLEASEICKKNNLIYYEYEKNNIVKCTDLNQNEIIYFNRLDYKKRS